MFITFEGGEGAGKTTQIVSLSRELAARGFRFLLTREPGGTELGRRIRELLLAPAHAGMPARAELLLYMADRADHIQRVIRPALAEGRIVVCDRFSDATVVYQGHGRELGAEWVRALHRAVFEDFTPDLTLLLDLRPAVGLARAARQLARGGRPASESRFEEETLLFHERIRAGYLQAAQREPGRFRVIDAERDEDRVRAEVLAAVLAFLEKRP
jgi:dTMP kinase